MKKYGAPEITVILECTRERVAESSVTFLDIEEGLPGWDILTFLCPSCKKIHKSVRYG